MSWLSLIEESLNKPVEVQVVSEKKSGWRRMGVLDDAPQTETIEPARLVNNPEFGNNVLLRVSNRNELLHLYMSADSMATALHSRLAK